ncbi:hypothetical protein PGT21_018380 [Puccinia graminis f. sp. tritici]|uniref:Uncharacterized protein n=1 Tax=Puccinia graminis f. sp. tritici TaxID=56615 RepID=A0A5B0R2I3_PUCGR|nr:hypothetical protein PGT21_018380 [Puccinia graminis f. sp. tritici]
MAFPSPIPRETSQITEEVHQPVTTINFVTTIEKTVIFGSPTAVAQVPRATAYANVNPVTWVPLVVLATVGRYTNRSG